ncbi:uncharacterized protein LOC123413520 [Hordeum vulgare subsp. vulgare]|uniref:Rx N-terminal domain-containing protein n=1 Tax=Hordeum vulgare subsp. vulgare TaxID=112509 RepID=A0A8I6YGW0_HORVV|nr:uncharacterized protein LOC123413520 [Hordeum vulgare subsp. vulgare]
MAELASGAVSSLLGVIRNEALLLGRVRDDVQFIQEEMESMKSFLAHLASSSAQAEGGQNEQLRTWMNQVRLLAQDSNNCIDLYLYRGNPELHLARGGLRRYVFWLPWFVHKMVAQRRAAVQLHALKERARDIGERRARYGVEIPAAAASRQSPTGSGAETSSSTNQGGRIYAASEDEEEDGDDQLVAAKEAAGHSVVKGAFFEPRLPEENVRVKLAEWMEDVMRHYTTEDESMPSVAIVAPDNAETLAIANEAMDMWKKVCTHGQSVLVDIPAVHFYSQLLRPMDILYYILWALQSPEAQPQQQDGQVPGEEEHDINKMRSDVNSKKQNMFEEIWEQIQGMKIEEKISEINNTIKEINVVQRQLNQAQMNDDDLLLLKSTKDEPIGVFLRALWLLKHKPVDSATATKKGQTRKEATSPKQKQDKYSYKDIINVTARKLKDYMEDHVNEKPKPKEHLEEDARTKPIQLKEALYEHIVHEMFPSVTIRKPPQIQDQDSKQATAITTTTGTTIILVEDQFKEMIRKILLDLQEEKSLKKPNTIELQEDKSIKKQGTVELPEGKSMTKQDSIEKPDTVDGKPSQDCIQHTLIEETIEMISGIGWTMYWQLAYKVIMDRINDCLQRRGHQKILVILKLDNDYVSGWEDTRNAFSTLGCIPGVLMLTTEVNRARAKEYCCPPREPIDYSLDGLYRDVILEFTRKKRTEDNIQPFLDILDKCDHEEFCMKIFVHALHANPKRSIEDLSKLNSTLQLGPKNLLDSFQKKMFKFSYSDLPNDYKSCLLYLAIFPKRQPIRRSTLIGRWVVEGLITTEDWASSVCRANRCFDALVNRWLVYPANIGATGVVKSCVVGDLIHGFITKIAKKQRIVESRVSHYLARHFSIFNDLRLRRSDRIDRFFQKLNEESFRVSLVKVLDLEGCQCFGGKNQIYLKQICRKMLLLKYLSLRGTNVMKLPSEINNLRELEVLDIRQTNVPRSATVNVLLLKLKRLLTGPPVHKSATVLQKCLSRCLAGSVVPSSGPDSNEIPYVPDKIGKMLNMEVLSNVKAQSSQHLKDIGKLWQLRKLGVTIEDNEMHIRNLLRAINDLHDCLKSLSITLPMAEYETSEHNFRENVLHYYKQPPKLLERLSIIGATQRGQLLHQLAKDNDLFQLAKVTLSGTRLKQADMLVLTKLPKILCLRLREKAYMDNKLTFGKEEFKNLKYFLVEGSNMAEITFEGGAPNLEKIVLCSTDGLESLSGVEGLHELKEVELNNNNKLSLFEKAKNISKVTFCYTILSQDELHTLAKLPNMRFLVLKENSYAQNHLIFKKDNLRYLNVLHIDFSVATNTSFEGESAPKLEKIVWSLTKETLGTMSVSGIENLPKLKELEFNGNIVHGEVEESLKKHRNKPRLTHNKPENQYQEAGNIPEKKDAARFQFGWKNPN